MIKKLFCLLLIGAGVSVIHSCTKLKEKVLDESSVTGLTEQQIAEGNIAPVYALLPTLYQHTNLFALQEISTDEAILPFRGGTDWGDNGIYLSLHRHETLSSDPNVLGTWTQIVQSISRSLTAITALATNNYVNAKTFLAEARAMRAYYNMMALDLFGISFKKEDPDGTSEILRGDDAINYIKSELLAAEPLLDNTTGPGRITKAGVWGLLARLYLNAAVWRDRYAASFTFKPEDMDKAIEYCDKIISSNQFQLASEYFSIFDNNNHSNPELIFAIDQRQDLNGHNRMAYFSLSGDQYPLASAPTANGTDGPAITPDFYQSWKTTYAPIDPADADPRFFKKNLIIPADSCISGSAYKINRGILRGQQYGIFTPKNGDPFATCTNGYKIVKLHNYSRGKPTLPVDFTEDIDFTVAGSNYSTGYRVEKYEFTSISSTNGRNRGEHDIVILRLADIYLMRAEAKLRKSNDAAGALADVNIVRASRTARGTPPPPLTSMTLDILFRERGFELYWEHQRRTDMIRFGKYEGTWKEKSNTDKNKRVFPIPITAINGASNIPGYLVQNPGY